MFEKVEELRFGERMAAVWRVRAGANKWQKSKSCKGVDGMYAELRRRLIESQ